jgi:signal transduction histidine kinase
MAQDVVVERESLTDDAKAFRTLIAELRGTQGHDLPASAARVDVPVLARAGAARSRRLARQLLAYARMQALAPARLEPSPFLRDLARSLRQALDARIDVVVQVGHDCPACLADRAALEETLLDLVANARDAMPEGGRLGLAARACVLPGQRPGVEISVSDSGPGMSGEAMERAGQPFSRPRRTCRSPAWAWPPPTGLRAAPTAHWRCTARGKAD